MILHATVCSTRGVDSEAPGSGPTAYFARERCVDHHAPNSATALPTARRFSRRISSYSREITRPDAPA